MSEKQRNQKSELLSVIKQFWGTESLQIRLSLIHAIANAAVEPGTSKEEFAQAIIFLLRVGNANKEAPLKPEEYSKDITLQAKARTCLVRHVLGCFPMDWCPNELLLALLKFFQWDHRHLPTSDQDIKRLRSFIEGYEGHLSSLAEYAGIESKEVFKIWVESLVFIGDYDTLIKRRISLAVPMLYNDIICNYRGVQDQDYLPEPVPISAVRWEDHPGPSIFQVLLLGRQAQERRVEIKEYVHLLRLIYALPPTAWKK